PTANGGVYFEQEGRMTVVLSGAGLLGLLGGWILAAVMALANRRPSSGLVTRSAVKMLSPDAINMAHIKVEGIGGLGLIAAGVLIAIYLPEIGMGLLAGVGLGTAV